MQSFLSSLKLDNIIVYKFSAKSTFLGKKFHYLPECHSTNDVLMDLSKLNQAIHGELICTDFQTNGKGQRANTWESKPSQNLLFSFLIKDKAIKLNNQFCLTILTSLGLIEVLKSSLNRNKIEIKWPNDIFINNKKTGGILLESRICSEQLNTVVVGVGLNIDQLTFSSETATSTRACGIGYSREDFLSMFIEVFENRWFDFIKNPHLKYLIEDYYRYLRWYQQWRIFQVNNLNIVRKILGIDESGRLLVTDGFITEPYDIKTIKFLS